MFFWGNHGMGIWGTLLGLLPLLLSGILPAILQTLVSAAGPARPPRPARPAASAQ